MSKTEQWLTEALKAAAGSVPDEVLRPLTVPPPSADAKRGTTVRRMLTSLSVPALMRGGRTERWLAPVAAAVAVAVVVAAVVALPHLLHRQPPLSPVSAAPVVPVGGFPTGIAFDAESGTIYVSGGGTDGLTMINTALCNASQHSGCAGSRRVSTDGSDPIGVAVNEATRTVYAVNGNSNTVAMINAATCNAIDSSGCTATPPLIHVGNGPEFLAVDSVTDTIYVANTGSGTVSVINGATCNASNASGCGKTPVAANAGSGAFPITVDAASNTVYVGLNNSVAVINGATCDAADVSGCAHAPAQISAGAPAGIAVDDANHTVYISGEQGTVTVVDRNTCDGADTAGCAGNHPAVAIGSDPRGNALDPSGGTLYATNAGSNTVSMINTATCNAATTTGCGATPATFAAGNSPRRIAVDPATHTVYVVNTGASSISMINTLTCDAVRRTGCPTRSPTGTTPLAARGGGDQSNCSPTVTAATSGQPAASFTSGATKLASGSVAGMPWSVWAKQGVAEPAALEDGGVVLNGRWYGLCAGFANVFEIELANLGPRGIDYGYVAYPGKAQVQLTSGGHVLPAPRDVALKGASFYIGTLPKSACAYKQMLTHARTASDSSMHQVGFGTCQSGKLVQITGSDGEWGSGQRQWTMAGFGLGGGGGGAADQSNCGPRVTPVTSGQPAAKFTSASTELASGSVGGMPWSVWAKRGVAEPTALEDGGVVLNGRWYGLCAGFPNVFETELANLGPLGIDYGFVGYPGKAEVKLTAGRQVLPEPQDVPLKGASFFIGTLPKSACAYKVLLTHARTAAQSSMHQLGFGRCQLGRVVDITGSDGEWGSGQAQWTMAGLGLAPASSFFGSGGGGGGGGGNLPNIQDQCSPGQTNADSGQPAARMTRSSVRVATGTTAGLGWSLWASRGTRGVVGVEQGGFVVNGRWYGLCPGAPNPAEFELLDAGHVSLVYGYVANPGPYKVHLSASIPAPEAFRVRGGTFFVGELPRSACSYSTVVLDAVNGGTDDMHQFDYGPPCHANQLATITGGHGSW